MQSINRQAEKLFRYNLSAEVINGLPAMDTAVVTCHGFGANKDIGFYVAEQISLPVVTFNFPDHDFRDVDAIFRTSYGTLNEYLPLLFLLQALVTQGITTLHLYGFSAGGGALIVTLSLLATIDHDAELLRIGIDAEKKSAIVAAISRGIVILDAPLRSVTEVLAYRPQEPFLTFLAQRYVKNRFEPILCIDILAQLILTLIIYVEVPDEILSNRDDEIFYQKICHVNRSGTTRLIRGSDGGHNGFHKKLWHACKDLL